MMEIWTSYLKPAGLGAISFGARSALEVLTYYSPFGHGWPRDYSKQFLTIYCSALGGPSDMDLPHYYPTVTYVFFWAQGPRAKRLAV